MNTMAQAALRRVYRYKWWQKCLYAVFGAFFILGGVGLAGTALAHRGDASGLSVAVLILALGVSMLLLAFRSRIVIDGSRIEMRGAFRTQSADLDEIEGFRTLRSRYGSFRQLILKNGRRPITIRRRFKTDDDYREWMRQTQDLDQRDRHALLTEIEQQQDLGATPEERLGALKAAKRNASALTVISAAAAVGLNFASKPWLMPSTAALIVAPFAAAFLCLRSPLLYTAFKRRSDPRGEATHPLIVSSLGMLYSMREPNFLSFKPLTALIALTTLALFSVLFNTARKSGNRGALIALVAFAALYGLGSVAVSDVFFDQSQGEMYTAQVTGHHITHERSTKYYLRLEPWGPVQTVEDVSVPSSEYRTTAIGDTVCPELHPGRLHAPWFRVRPCSQ